MEQQISHEVAQDLAQKLDKLTDERSITAIRNDADKSYAGITETQWRELRRRAKTDLYWLSKGILGHNKLSPNLHGSLCGWMERNEKAQYKEILLPRGHYKSTVITVADSIRITLTDDENNCTWPRNLGPNSRVLIAHEIVDSAGKFLSEISGHFLSNKKLMWLFPELIPSKREQRINLYELELPRQERWGEATFGTMGVGGRSQGYHYNYLKLDDLIGEKTRDSKTEMIRAKGWFDNIQAFYSSFNNDCFDLVGTRWAYDDLYKHAHDTYGSKLLRYIRSAEEIDPKTGQIVSIFPEEFTREKFDVLKKNKRNWAAQYANDPGAGSARFQQSWKRFFVWNGYNQIRYANKTYNVEEMDVCILIDPAMVGKAGFLVTGVAFDGNIFILEAAKEEWTPPELVDLIFKSVSRWNPRVVAIEKVLFSGLFEHWLLDAMKLRGTRFRVEPISTGGREKEARVEGLANYYAAGQIIYHSSQVQLIEEHNAFGATEDYHMLDALAQGPQVWRKGVRRVDIQNAEKAELILTGPDNIGGY